MSKLFKHRVGEKSIHLKTRLEMTIIKYDNCRNITVRFEDGIIVHTNYHNFASGHVRHQPLYYGIPGVVGPSKGESGTFVCRAWHNMMSKCYGQLSKQESYRGCRVNPDFLDYNKFKAWFLKHSYRIEGETMQLDKDLLQQDADSLVYGPGTCSVLPQKINNAIRCHTNGVNTGIFLNKDGRYDVSRVHRNGKCIGTYNSFEEAFSARKAAKEDYVRKLADSYGDKLPSYVRDGVYRWEYKPGLPKSRSSVKGKGHQQQE